MRHFEGTFTATNGDPLFEQHWFPETTPRADVVIVHGYAEHSGRYEHVAAYLAERGYAVHALDLRGHGRSAGERVLVRSFNEYLDDVAGLLVRVHEGTGRRPIFLLGHSMGGTIVALASVTRRPDVRGVMLSGAGLTAGRGPQAVLAQLLVWLGQLFPRLPLRKLAAETVSHDPDVVAKYDSDPLVYRGKMPAGTLSAMIRAGRTIHKRIETVTQPLLIMHGTADALTEPDGSRELYERAVSSDKTLKLYEGFFHEILNEPERAQVLGDIAAWLDARCDA